ncbi:MAG: response regulator [Planctomycetota bacterium]|jgi:DNA-binding response OmpR family regulator
MADTPRIVVIEDEKQVRDLLLVVLGDAGFQAAGAENGHDGLAIVREQPTDLVLLDFQLPGGVSGLEVCRRLRGDAATAKIPIIVLTGQVDDNVELSFLEAGADDYIRKNNFKAAVLIGRINAVLRRTRQTDTDVVQTEHLTIHPARREVLADGQVLNLTPTEFDILYKLATNTDRALSRRELLDRGGGEGEGEGVDRTVDVHVLSIRRKLGKYAWLVSTVWGVGYRLGTDPGA